MFAAFLTSSIRFSAAFLYGSTGEIITQKSGHLNLGIPGVMSVGAAVGCVVELGLLKASVSSPILLVLIPLLATVLAGVAMGALFSFMTVTLKANQNITGLAMTTFGVGLSGHIINGIRLQLFTISKASKYYRKLLPFTNSLGDFGKIFFSHGILVYLAIVIAIFAQIILNKTRIGLNLRAVGENPATADAVGVNVTLYRYVATMVGCGISAIGGLFTIMDYMGGNWEYMIEALGWLSIALVIFTLWRPVLAIFGSIIFGGLYIVSSYVTGISLAQIELIKMVPYIVTVIVLIVTSIFDSKNAQPPAALGIPYFREER